MSDDIIVIADNIIQEVILNTSEYTITYTNDNQYEIVFHNVTQIDQVDIRNTTFIYDTNGDLYRVQKSDGSHKTFSYNLDGSINNITDGSNTWSYIYDSNGNLINIQVI